MSQEKYQKIIDRVDDILTKNIDSAARKRLIETLPDIKRIHEKRENNEKITLQDVRSIIVIFRYAVLPEVEKAMLHKVAVLKAQNEAKQHHG